MGHRESSRSSWVIEHEPVSQKEGRERRKGGKREGGNKEEEREGEGRRGGCHVLSFINKNESYLKW